MGDRFGRFGGTATWVLVALSGGPLAVVRLLDRVRQLDGFVRPGTFYGAVVRLEHYDLIERTTDEAGQAAYRLGQRAGAESR